MDRITHKVRCEHWSAIISECLASGMNKTAWCRENGISDKAFFYWQRILRQEAYVSSQLPAVTKPAPPASETVDFVELKQPLSSSEPASFRPDIIIRKDSVIVEISNTASSELISRIGGILHA